MSDFPQQISECTVDETRDDDQFLKALGLTARSWVEHTREYLFQSISVDARDTSPDGACHALVLLIKKRPSVQFYFGHLIIRVKDTLPSVAHFAGTDVQTTEGLASLLPLLSFVTTLSIVGTGDGGRSSWTNIPRLVRGSLLHLISRSKIDSLHIHKIGDIPGALFAHLPHLQHLRLFSASSSATSFHESGYSTQFHSLPRPSIRTLQVYDSHLLAFALFWPLPTQTGPRARHDTHQLLELEIYIDFDDHNVGRAWSAVLDHCSKIEKYTVVQDCEYPPTRHFPQSVLNLRRFPNLQVLQLSWYYTIIPEGGFNHNPLPGFVTNLAQIANHNQLRTVELNVRCEH
ncbi:hypothetical protein D9611_009028 [Ephemerocybe angulata]|uniref:Uncharacterized protein n=1 Tax=Ephemerocybe angulata TaxID=980116 RepID=A0A8H5CE94_9AGAR|nr:hypothetical protein D9611_009028 [Tulosesus angulatus]